MVAFCWGVCVLTSAVFDVFMPSVLYWMYIVHCLYNVQIYTKMCLKCIFIYTFITQQRDVKKNFFGHHLVFTYKDEFAHVNQALRKCAKIGHSGQTVDLQLLARHVMTSGPKRVFPIDSHDEIQYILVYTWSKIAMVVKYCFQTILHITHFVFIVKTNLQMCFFHFRSFLWNCF